MAAFKKHLLISSETARLSRDGYLLDRVAWQDVGEIKNFCDYDTIVINLTAVLERLIPQAFKAADVDKVFDIQSWAHVVLSGGHIFVIGNPECGFQVPNTISPKPAPPSRGKLIVIIRSMDVFCLSILKLLGLLEVDAFWKEFYQSKGSFDAAKYWGMLPPEFQIQKQTS